MVQYIPFKYVNLNLKKACIWHMYITAQWNSLVHIPQLGPECRIWCPGGERDTGLAQGLNSGNLVVLGLKPLTFQSVTYRALTINIYSLWFIFDWLFEDPRVYTMHHYNFQVECKLIFLRLGLKLETLLNYLLQFLKNHCVPCGFEGSGLIFLFSFLYWYLMLMQHKRHPPVIIVRVSDPCQAS